MYLPILTRHGRFRLAVLHTNTIMDRTTLKKRRTTLRGLVSGSEGDFKTAIERIRNQSGDDAEQGIKTLAWIFLARRPLLAHELLHALAVEEGDEGLCEDNIPDRNTLLDCCLGLAVVDEESSVIRFVNASLCGYFERNPQELAPYNNAYMAKICLTYLLMHGIASLASTFLAERDRLLCDRDFSGKDFLRRYPFPAAWMAKFALLQYAAVSWPEHARHDDEDGDELALMLRYFSSDALHVGVFCLCSQEADLSMIASLAKSDILACTPMHIAARFGLAHAIPHLLSTCSSLDTRDAHRKYTPLSWAAEGGYASIVKAILDTRRADPNLTDSGHNTSLMVAAKNGHAAVIAELIQHKDIDVNTRNFEGRSPLISAIERGHLDVMRELLKHPQLWPNKQQGPPPKPHPPFHCSVEDFEAPLHEVLSSRQPRIEAVNLLLAAPGIDASPTNEDGETPLGVAIECRWLDAVLALRTARATSPSLVEDLKNTSAEIRCLFESEMDTSSLGAPVMSEEQPQSTAILSFCRLEQPVTCELEAFQSHLQEMAVVGREEIYARREGRWNEDDGGE